MEKGGAARLNQLEEESRRLKDRVAGGRWTIRF